MKPKNTTETTAADSKSTVGASTTGTELERTQEQASIGGSSQSSLGSYLTDPRARFVLSSANAAVAAYNAHRGAVSDVQPFGTVCMWVSGGTAAVSTVCALIHGHQAVCEHLAGECKGKQESLDEEGKEGGKTEKSD